MRNFGPLLAALTLVLSAGLLFPAAASARDPHREAIEKLAQQFIDAAAGGQSLVTEADFGAVADQSGLDPNDVLIGISYAISSPKLGKGAQPALRALYSKLAMLQQQRRAQQGYTSDIGMQPLPSFSFAGGSDYAR